MPYFAVKDANGDIIYVAATGAGTTGDPYVPTRTFTNSIPAGTAVIGKVDQGTGGVSAWKVDGSGVTQPVSAASLPLPTGAATAANQTTANASLSSIDGKLPAQGQALAAASLPVVLPAAQLTILTPPAAITGFATETTLAGVLTQSDFDTKVGALTETAPATDTASSGLNGRAQRIAQRITSLIALLPSAIGQNAKSNSLSVVTASDDDMIGSKTETAPASDTASSGLNGRLQRIAQNITSLIAKLPAALGQTTKAASLSVTLASDYQAPIVPANVSPAWTNIGANNTDGVASMDVSNYRSGSLQLSGTWSATIAIQVSNDNANWTTIAARNVAIPSSGLYSQSLTSTGTFAFPLLGINFLRIRTTAYASGTVVGVVLLSSTALNEPSFIPVGIANGASVTDAVNMAIQGALNNAFNSAYIPAPAYDFNGATWDRRRSVGALSVLASSARTTDTSSSDQTNYSWRGMALTLNVSAQSGGSVKLALQIKDSISGNYATVWTATAAQTAVGTYTYLLYPGALDAASWTEKVQLALAMRTWRITTTTANGSSITYSVSADMLL